MEKEISLEILIFFLLLIELENVHRNENRVKQNISIAKKTLTQVEKNGKNQENVTFFGISRHRPDQAYTFLLRLREWYSENFQLFYND